MSWGSNPFTSYGYGNNSWPQPWSGGGGNSGSFNSGALQGWDPYGGSSGMPPWMSGMGGGSSMPPWMNSMGGGSMGGQMPWYMQGSIQQMFPGVGTGNLQNPGNTGGLGYGGMGGQMGFAPSGAQPWMQTPQQYSPPNMNTPNVDSWGMPPGGNPASRPSGYGLGGTGYLQGPGYQQSGMPAPDGTNNAVTQQEIQSGNFAQPTNPTMLQGPTAAMFGGAAPWQGAQYNLQAGRWM